MTDHIQYVWLTIYLFALVSLFTYGMNCYLLMIFYRLKRSKALKQHAAIKKNFYHRYSVRDWPRVTIQLPIFNERYVVERLIQSVCQFDYPRELLEIQILDDSTGALTFNISTVIIASASRRAPLKKASKQPKANWWESLMPILFPSRIS
jgi:cellulose synthase/poly-beta-1,6-N-acetylglucosamine synthase-like glycosyltransferase